jgi:hypothetical protein
VFWAKKPKRRGGEGFNDYWRHPPLFLGLWRTPCESQRAAHARSRHRGAVRWSALLATERDTMQTPCLLMLLAAAPRRNILIMGSSVPQDCNRRARLGAGSGWLGPAATPSTSRHNVHVAGRLHYTHTSLANAEHYILAFTGFNKYGRCFLRRLPNSIATKPRQFNKILFPNNGMHTVTSPHDSLLPPPGPLPKLFHDGQISSTLHVPTATLPQFMCAGVRKRHCFPLAAHHCCNV